MLQRITILASAFIMLGLSSEAQTKTITTKPVVPAPNQNTKPVPVQPQIQMAPPTTQVKPLPPLKRLNEKMEYAIVVDKKVGTTPKEGDLIKLHMISAINGQMMYNSAQQNKGKPVEFNVNKPGFKSDVINLIMLMTPGDSAVCLADAADIFANIKKALPNGIKKGDKMAYYVKLVSIKPVAEIQKEQQAKMQKQMQEQMAKSQKERDKQLLLDDKKLKAYFTKNGIQPTKLNSGAYYQITKPGEGKNAEKNGKLKLNYKVKLMDGTLVDGNVDTNGALKAPYEYFQGARGFNATVDEVMTNLNKGSQAIIFVPSSLGFGKYKQPRKQGFVKEVGENANLIYEVDIVDVLPPVNEEENLAKHLETKGITNAIKTASGMYYIITKEGSGDSPKVGEKMVMNYTGYHLDGTKFDSNVDSSFNHVQPFEFELGKNQVIKGWDEGVGYLKKGARATFFIPSALGYGSSDRPKIPAFSTLLFDVELVDIKK